ncbi:MAG: type II toxin-antitoxin system Phd/YefM family antitoxin [Caldiserica bacterium]|nr:type II toxin-antitoxin system Phd/YefM family antitoxin [Caldisericota bacterium]
MVKTISTMKIRARLGEILEEVFYKKDQFIVKRGNKPMAAIVPVEQLDAWLNRREEFFALIEKIRARNKDVSPEEVERDIERAIKEVRGL